jgi:hypothetical protein
VQHRRLLLDRPKCPQTRPCNVVSVAALKRRRPLIKPILCTLAVISVLTLAACGTNAATPPHTANTAGQVVGGIDPCEGLAFTRSPRYAAGTVTVFKGWPKTKHLGNRNFTYVFPTHIVGTATVGQNSTYRLVLAPGRYTLQARYVHGNVHPFAQVAVTRGKVSLMDIPNMCK